MINYLLKNKNALPHHVAIIMDGNGRWATGKGLPRTAGHKAGIEQVKPILEFCKKIGIPFLSLFVFSTENWNRPEAEVNIIMNLLGEFIDKETEDLRKKAVRLRFSGSSERLSPELCKKMEWASEVTSKKFSYTLNVCINYGGRDEILNAVHSLIKSAAMQNFDLSTISEDIFSKYLYTTGMPYPDLLIRTGGDRRISNFLLWQIAYAEIIFYPKFWPDFTPEDFAECLKDYLSRERRFGQIKETDDKETDDKLLLKINSPSDLKNLSNETLKQLAQEIRNVILSQVSETGGHLASNLGIVELTISLHKVFDSPNDKIIWDVGHQCYPHKLLTGRYKIFTTLRRRDGISGFPKRSESEHDCFNTGHGSTSISAALGIAVGRDLNQEISHIVGICGDGAMSGGMIFEAINHAGELRTKLIIILNDNSFSISPVTGALSRYLSKIRINSSYVRFHQTFHKLKYHPLKVFGVLSFLTSPVRRLGKYFAFKKGIIFEELGFHYVGPVDGHNIDDLVNVLDRVKKIKGPILLHVFTQKGKGYKPAEIDPPTYHGVNQLKNNSEVDVNNQSSPTFTNTFYESMRELCKNDKRIVGITAAMPSGTGLYKLIQEYPHRFFDVGMAESHAVTFAAGLATQGLRPVVAIYSTFLQRAYDQLFHDVCLQDLPVVFAIDRAGLVGKYGETHQGLMDIAYLRHLPNIIILAPKDTRELDAMLHYALRQEHPVAIRYPNTSDAEFMKLAIHTPIEHSKAEILQEGNDIALWAVGVMATPALQAAKILQQHRLKTKVINVRFIKPMDEKTLLESYKEEIKYHFTIEEHLLSCGFGSLFLEVANSHKLDLINITRIGVEHALVANDSREALLRDFGLTGKAIASRVLKEVQEHKHFTRHSPSAYLNM